MIAVLAKAGQTAIVEEFFELFKTPWEFYQPGGRYDVLLTTTGEIPAPCAALIVVSGSELTSVDAHCGIATGTRSRGVSVDHRGTCLPIYGELLAFERGSAATPCLETTAGIGA